jgi:general secretion pathway protein A
MYLDFYGLKEKPFSTTPDPRFLLLTPTHREALAQLVYGVREGTGFAVLTGEVGTGKTTLLRTLLQRIDSEVAVAFVVNPTLGFDGLLEYIFEDLGIRKGGDTPAQRLMSLQRFLVGRAAAGHRTLIVIDEAQHLDPPTLEQIRLLSNFESSSQKLLQIVLAGQPELEAKLALPELRQLKQRIGLRCTVRPLTPGETADYIRTRLRIAGAPNLRLYTDQAATRVARYARGVPRVINILCEHCLLIGYADQVRQIDDRVVAEAIRTIEAGDPGVGDRTWARWKLPRVERTWIVGVATALVVGTAGGAIWYAGGPAALGDAMSMYGARVTDAIHEIRMLVRP